VHKNRVLSPEIDVYTHYQTLKEILERAENLQIRLTGAKLVDAWFHKGAVKNRIETPPPNLDRFIAEQIIAYLLINDYLKEDFQYTAYTTNSYITVGGRKPSKNVIKYQSSRIFELPAIDSASNSNDESDCEIVTTSNGKKRRKESADSEKNAKRKPSIVHKSNFRSDSEDDVIEIPQKHDFIDLSG
jgi:ATP-dependent DNA helicase Q1